MSEHTPTPWHTEPNGPCFNLKCADRVDHFAILVGMKYGNVGEHEANADFIVRACNAHDDLLAACKELLEEHHLFLRGDSSDWQCPFCGVGYPTALDDFQHTDTCPVEKARAAIANAKEKP